MPPFWWSGAVEPGTAESGKATSESETDLSSQQSAEQSGQFATFELDLGGTAEEEEVRAPEHHYIFGTDDLGRDVFSRVIYGARLSLLIGFISVGIALMVGMLLGLVSGYYGRWLDDVIMRSMDILLSIPYVLLAILIVAILGPGLVNAMIAIGIVSVPHFARIVRGSVLSLKQSEYVQAARVLGAGDIHIIFRHILRNSLSPIIVQTTLTFASAILSAAALGFLGLGAQPPTPEWGVMLADGRKLLLTSPWSVIFPGAAIVIFVLGFNLLGDGLRDALDVRMKD
ncbi:MAG: ABC transporter permease [Synergistales bacterium]|nr:ABC transporter permease [Synergistales bacterium]